MDWLIKLLQANALLEPLVIAAIEALRKSGQTDEQVIADARAKVAETDQITTQDQGPQA